MSTKAGLQTRCPGCGTVFRVTVEQLAVAGGNCRCGVCHSVFDANAAAVPSVDLPGHVEQTPGTAPTPGLGGAPVRETEPPADTGVRSELVVAEWELPEQASPDRRLTEAREPPRRRRWPWSLAAILLLLMVAAQLLWWQRATLLADARLRPWIVSACGLVGCDVGLPVRPERVIVVSRSLSPVPGDEASLRFTARIVNRAAVAIEWPHLRLQLHALNGTVVAERSFTPAEYLDGSVPAAGMLAGTPVAVAVEISDSGQQVTGFEVDFY